MNNEKRGFRNQHRFSRTKMALAHKANMAVTALIAACLCMGLSGCGGSQSGGIGSSVSSVQSVTTVTSSSSKKSQKVVRYTVKKTSIYKKADDSSKKIAKLNIAAKVSGIDNGSGWVKTKQGKTTGYVKSSALGSKKDANAAKKEAKEQAAAKKAAKEKAKREAAEERAAAQRAAEKKAEAKRRAEQKKAAKQAVLAGAISWKDCGDHIGEQVRVYGKVVETKYASYSNGGPAFLDVGAPYGDDSRVTVLIWEENRGNFGSHPETYYYGKTICVSGFVDVYAGACQIEVTDPSQITVV